MNEITTLAVNGQEYTLTDAGAVAFDKVQTLTDEQQLQARLNIDAASATDVENEIDRLDAAIAGIGTGDTSSSTPVFDLDALGIDDIPFSGGSATLETDTTEILSALENGPVTFIIPVSDNGETTLTRCTMSGMGVGSDYVCTSVLALDAYTSLTVMVGAGYIGVVLAPMETGGAITVDDALSETSTNPVQNKVVTEYLFAAMNILQEQVFPNLAPAVTADDNGKFLRVVDGVWSAVTVADAEEVSF